MTDSTMTESEADKHPRSLDLTAYSAWGFGVRLEPAHKRRDWMDAIPAGFPYHCLPMTLASQSGWFMLAPHGCIAEWNGGAKPTDISVIIPDPPPPDPNAPPTKSWSRAPAGIQVQSAVGHGIITWTIPYVFRTPPGWNLLCRGPANVVKDGIAPLEGIIETDWTTSSFSMNWKFTRPGKVQWNRGDPVAMLLPQRRGDLEQFRCRMADMNSNPELAEGYRKWIEGRVEFLEAQKRGDTEAIKKRFEKHYFHGTDIKGRPFHEHQKARDLSEFTAPVKPPA